MANYCMNTVDIEGKEESIKKLALALKEAKRKKEDSNINFSNFCNLVLGKPIQTYSGIYPDTTYGTKWWDLDVDYTAGGRYLTLSGSSAWSPPVDFIEQISKVFNVDAYIHYSEDGIGFSGSVSYSNGEVANEEYYERQ